MAISYNYNHEDDALYLSVEGKITMDDLRGVLKDITESEEFSSSVKTLWDLREMDFTGIDLNFGEQLVTLRSLDSARGETKIALIADKDSKFGLSRMYTTISDSLPQSMMVFRDFESGRKWLLSDDKA